MFSMCEVLARRAERVEQIKLQQFYAKVPQARHVDKEASMATNKRPFVPGGIYTDKKVAQDEARKLTRERDPEIWTIEPAKAYKGQQRWALKRVS